MLDLEGDNLRQGLLALVVALLEVVKEALVHAAVRRVEGGRLSDTEIERLGNALAELEDAVDQIKAEHGVADAVRNVRDDLDGLVGDLIHGMAGGSGGWRQSALMHDPAQDGPILRAQGALSFSPWGCWRLGWLDLQGSTFTFHGSGGHAAVRIDLGDITGLDRERRTFILVSKHVLRLTYRPGAAARRRLCWLITARLDDWQAALGQQLAGWPDEAPAAELPAPAARRLAARLTGLSATSALILDYLACRGHATTAELMTLIGAGTEESLLAEMHAGFRQLVPVLGGPAVRYADRYFDAASREVRQQTWRIGEKVAAGWLASRVPTELLMEGDELLIITSLPTQARGARPSAQAAADGRGLVLRHAHGHDRWIGFPEPVVGEPRCAVSPAGTLVISGLRRAPGSRAPGIRGNGLT